MADSGKRYVMGDNYKKRVDATVQSYENTQGPGDSDPRRARGGGANTPNRAAKTRSGGIPKQVGDTPGSATVDLYAFDPGSGAWASLGVSVTAYNMATSSDVAGNIYIQLQWCGGVLVCVWEDCP